MIRVTRWSPDTCGCVLEYSWDDTKPSNERKHIFKGVVKACHLHSRLPPKIIYEVVLDENMRKNKAFALAQELNPELTSEDYKWSFTDERVLKVELAKLADPEKNRLRDLCNAQLGTGRIEIA